MSFLPKMDIDGNIYDSNTIFIETNGLTRSEINNEFCSILKYLDIECNLFLNYIMIKGEHNGKAYVFFTDSRAYFALIGRNKDGSERVDTIVKEEPFTPPEQPLEEALKDFYSGKIKDWSIDEDVIRDRYVPKKIYEKVQLPSLISELKYIKFVPDNIDEGDWRPYIEDRILVVMRARIQSIHEGFVPYMLITSNLVHAIDREDIKDLYITFSSNPKYPIIKQIKSPGNDYNKKRYTIRYDPSTNDAAFALLMTRANKVCKNKTIYDIYTNYCRAKS